MVFKARAFSVHLCTQVSCATIALVADVDSTSRFFIGKQVCNIDSVSRTYPHVHVSICPSRPVPAGKAHNPPYLCAHAMCVRYSVGMMLVLNTRVL